MASTAPVDHQNNQLINSSLVKIQIKNEDNDSTNSTVNRLNHNLDINSLKQELVLNNSNLILGQDETSNEFKTKNLIDATNTTTTNAASSSVNLVLTRNRTKNPKISSN